MPEARTAPLDGGFLVGDQAEDDRTDMDTTTNDDIADTASVGSPVDEDPLDIEEHRAAIHAGAMDADVIMGDVYESDKAGIAGPST